jgi:hypothetical protein
VIELFDQGACPLGRDGVALAVEQLECRFGGGTFRVFDPGVALGDDWYFKRGSCLRSSSAPPYPVRCANWFVLGVILVGVLVMVWLERMRRSALDDAGRVFVETDEPARATALS